MSIAEWLFETMKQLGEAGVDSPRRDALVLLEDTLDKNRSWVLAHDDYKISNEQLEQVNQLITRRLGREPLAYIRGKVWFYGRFFEVSSTVMIPRPESEDFIDLLKELKPQSIVDVGTGSGCLAVTAKLELPRSRVLAIDASSEILEVARKNARKHEVVIEFIESYLLDDLAMPDGATTAIIANLPYVPKGLVTSPEILQEPAEAIFSGDTGLDHYQTFWGQLSTATTKPAHVLTESLESQHASLLDLAIKSGYSLDQTRGLIQHFTKIENS